LIDSSIGGYEGALIVHVVVGLAWVQSRGC
jgi:hypothetical protein